MKQDRARERTLQRRAREREEDRAAGRPQRGLLTGRGRRQAPEDSVLDEEELDDVALADEDYDELEDDFDDQETVSGRPRVGAKRTVMGAIKQVPAYIRLLFRLMRDSRVSRIDRLLVLAAAAYMISPLDFIPDLIPFFGEADDLFLVVLALQRLIDNAGRRVLLDHWSGDPRDLSDVNLTSLVSAAGFSLPPGIKKRLRGFVNR